MYNSVCVKEWASFKESIATLYLNPVSTKPYKHINKGLLSIHNAL